MQMDRFEIVYMSDSEKKKSSDEMIGIIEFSVSKLIEIYKRKFKIQLSNRSLDSF